jgi:hypothetical protein
MRWRLPVAALSGMFSGTLFGVGMGFLAPAALWIDVARGFLFGVFMGAFIGVGWFERLARHFAKPS